MAKYSQETIAEVLAANDIVDIIGATVDLKPSGGSRFKGLCPFHQEKTPSFVVNRDRQAFYCFGCEKGGDAISFLMEHDGLPFFEAVRNLADRGSVRLPALDERDNKEDWQRAKLLELGRFSARFYIQTLRDPLKGGKARQYLNQRALSEETIKSFGLGYAPDGWSALCDAVRDGGFRENLVEASGLARRGERGTLYDFFRDRLMFPIRDVAGNVVAFGGRDLSGDAPGKYINTPENAVYKKSRTLYGLHESRDALRKSRRAILVEGYFDLLRCFDVGVQNVVASCGTALTGDQAKLLHRYVRDVVIVYDGDPAGIRAALRGVAILTAAGLSVHALVLPDGQDPDDYIKAEGGEAFQALVDRALDIVTFYVQSNKERLTSIEGRTEVAQEIFGILHGVGDDLRRDAYLEQMGKALGFDVWTVKREYGKAVAQSRGRGPAKPEEPSEPARYSQDDCDFIAALINSEPLLDEARETLDGFELDSSPVMTIFKALIQNDASTVFEDDATRSLYAAASNQTVHDDEKARERQREKYVEVVHKRLRRIRQEALEAEIQHLQQDIREAETAKETDRMLRLIARKQQLDRRREELGGT